MDRTLIIEVSNPAKRQKERHRVATFPVTIGRSYSNSVIIDDPHVCPFHLRIEDRNGSGIVAVDLESVNGLLDGGQSPTREVQLRSGTRFTIGETEITVFDGSETLPPSVSLRSRMRRLARIASKKRTGVALILTLAVIQSLLACTLKYSREASNPFVTTFIPTLLTAITVFASWASCWSLLSSLLVHRANFGAHLSIAAIAGYLGLFVFNASEYGEFAFDGNLFLVWPILIGMAIAWTLFAHLRFATNHTRRSALIIAGCIATSVLVVPAIYVLVKDRPFDQEMRLSEVLKPPPFRVVDGVSVDEFLAQTSEIDEDLQEALAEAK